MSSGWVTQLSCCWSVRNHRSVLQLRWTHSAVSEALLSAARWWLANRTWRVVLLCLSLYDQFMQTMKSRSAGIKVFPSLQYNILNIYPQYFVINVQLWTIMLFRLCAEDHSPTCRKVRGQLNITWTKDSSRVFIDKFSLAASLILLYFSTSPNPVLSLFAFFPLCI